MSDVTSVLFSVRNRSFLPIIVAVAAVSGGCGQETIIVPSRTLDRPTDLAFLCLRSSSTSLGGRSHVSAVPMSECSASPLKEGDVRDPDSPSRNLGLFGLVTNSARGELGAVDFDKNRMVDLDTAIPGFNMLPVGQLPESVAVSSDGCKAVSANRGSCDISLVDSSRLLAGVFASADPVTGPGAVATRLPILTDSSREHSWRRYLQRRGIICESVKTSPSLARCCHVPVMRLGWPGRVAYGSLAQ
jgi:hypothetical protein